MEYTQNYQLPLWDKEDAIKRTDFNDNNSKIDAALAAETTARENAVAVAKNEAAAALAAYKSSNDAALAAEVSARDTLAATVAKCGNYKIVYGSYTGTGTYGSENAITLTFDHKPLLVAVLPQSSLNSAGHSVMMVRGSRMFFSFPEYPNSRCTVTWTDNAVSWYNSSSDVYQFNSSTTYFYVALLAADE